jgi:hypothetical protein
VAVRFPLLSKERVRERLVQLENLPWPLLAKEGNPAADGITVTTGISN